MRSGASKRELAQKHVVAAPNVMNEIMTNPDNSPKHRIDSARALDAMAANGSEKTADAEKFVISIVLGGETKVYSQQRKPNEPRTIDADDGEKPAMAAIAAKKGDGGDDQPL